MRLKPLLLFAPFLYLTTSCVVFQTSSSVNTRNSPSARATAPATRTPQASTARPNAARPSSSLLPATVSNVIRAARSYTGTPYRLGGNDKSGIDCSGLIAAAYQDVGRKVPRISWQQAEFGREVERIEDIQPGDWLFFVPDAGKEGYVSHSGIVTEVRGKQEIIFIHASTSRGVREDNLFSTYFKPRFVKAMRPF